MPNKTILDYLQLATSCQEDANGGANKQWAMLIFSEEEYNEACYIDLQEAMDAMLESNNMLEL